MDLVSLLVGLVIICLVFWAARALMAAFGIGEPIATVVNVLLVVLVIAWLATWVTGAHLSVVRVR